MLDVWEDLVALLDLSSSWCGVLGWWSEGRRLWIVAAFSLALPSVLCYCADATIFERANVADTSALVGLCCVEHPFAVQQGQEWLLSSCRSLWLSVRKIGTWSIESIARLGQSLP